MRALILELAANRVKGIWLSVFVPSFSLSLSRVLRWDFMPNQTLIRAFLSALCFALSWEILRNVPNVFPSWRLLEFFVQWFSNSRVFCSRCRSFVVTSALSYCYWILIAALLGRDIQSAETKYLRTLAGVCRVEVMGRRWNLGSD